MMRSKRLPLYIAGGAGLSALVVGLGLTATHAGSTATAVSTSPASTVVATRDTALGQILVDGQGRTLYLFAKDTGTASTCDGSCASYWPPVPVSGVPHAAAAAAAKLGAITRPGGTQQLTYAGHPLYYFVKDRKAGQTTGQALDQFGAKWYALDAAGTAVVTAPASDSDGTVGGYGY